MTDNKAKTHHPTFEALEVLQHPFFQPHYEKQTEEPWSDPEQYIEEETEDVETTDDDPHEMEEISVGSMLNDRYMVEAVLGEGSFGVVTKCNDTELNQAVAVKIHWKDSLAVQQTKEEIAILQKLQKLDANTCNIVQYLGFFPHMDKTCIKFELLDQSLEAYMSDGEHQPLTITEVSPIVHQLATALHHLKYLGIVHADLKPENAMIVNRYEQPLRVKLIDFGLSFESAAAPCTDIGTDWYTAPEVMLGISYNEPIDMWSLGVTMVELVIGFPLYPGEDYYAVLSFIQDTQGPLPEYMLECGTLTGKYFHHQPNDLQQWWLKTPEEYEHETGIRFEDLRYFYFKSINEIQDYMELQNGVQDGQELFVDLMKSMLRLDPNDRIKPLEVLQHPFFQLQHENQTEQPQSDLGHHLEEELEVDVSSAPDNGTSEMNKQTNKDREQQPESDNHKFWFPGFFRKVFARCFRTH